MALNEQVIFFEQIRLSSVLSFLMILLVDRVILEIGADSAGASHIISGGFIPVAGGSHHLVLPEGASSR